MDTSSAGESLVFELSVAAPPERLWEAWTTSGRLAGWWADRLLGEPAAGQEIVFHWPSFFDFRTAYQVRAASPPSLLSLDSPQGSLKIEIAPAETGAALRLTAGGLPGDEEVLQSIRSGWLISLALFRRYVEREWDRTKQIYLDLRAVPFEYERLIELYRAPRRESWLPLPGAVLADTGSEVLLDWPEGAGAIELKAFPFHGRRVLGIRALSWGAERPGAHREFLLASMDRLLKLITEP